MDNLVTYPIRFLVALVLGGTVALASATPSTLYVTDLDRSVTDDTLNPYGVSVVQVQGGNVVVVDSWRHGALLGGEVRDTFLRGPLAVADGRIDVLGPYNHGYATDGSGQVSAMCLGANGCNFGGTANDGATDGTYNYTVSRDSNGVHVWRTDRRWGDGAALFDIAGLGANESAFGITYDPFNRSLWVQVGPTSGTGGFRILELGLNGVEKSRIDANNASPTPFLPALLAGALAMDYEDQSLWWVQFGDLPTGVSTDAVAVRFDRQGQMLSFLEPESCNEGNLAACWPFRPVYGAEFEFRSPATVPEPSTAALVAMAAAALGLRRRRLR